MLKGFNCIITEQILYDRIYCFCLVMSDSFAVPWTVACQVPLSRGFTSKINGEGCHFLLQGIFPTQGSNLHLLHWQVGSLPLSHQGSPDRINLLKSNKFIEVTTHLSITQIPYLSFSTHLKFHETCKQLQISTREMPS